MQAGRVLITGAAGNLGSHLARHLHNLAVPLRLMVHGTPLDPDLRLAADIEVVKADLGQPATLAPAVHSIETVVHFAGVLFKPRPERFLLRTNTEFVHNLATACVRGKVDRVILISFPHVEGPTTVDNPATGRLDQTPISAHAQTRLLAEKALLAAARDSGTRPVILRCGTVYGTDVKMVEAACWLLRRNLIAVWPGKTDYHFLSLPDLLNLITAAVLKRDLDGILLLGDREPVSLQWFLDRLADQIGAPRPLRLPRLLFPVAASLVETYAEITGSGALLTRDFVRLGMVPHVMDTSRMRNELLDRLAYPTVAEGVPALISNRCGVGASLSDVVN